MLSAIRQPGFSIANPAKKMIIFGRVRYLIKKNKTKENNLSSKVKSVYLIWRRNPLDGFFAHNFCILGWAESESWRCERMSTKIIITVKTE